MEYKILFHDIGKDPMYKTWHVNSDTMLLYLHSDGGSIVFADEIYPMKKGVLCYIRADKYHYTLPDSPDTYDRSKLSFSQDMLERLLKFAGCSENNLFFKAAVVYAQIPLQEQSRVEHLFEKTIKDSCAEELNSLEFVSNLLQILLYCHRYATKNVSQQLGFVIKAIEYINENRTENISIDDICAQVKISKYYLCHSFKKATGNTVADYILQTRLIHSKKMLVETDFSIQKIVEKCGFSSISYFSRVFKKNVGISPLKYRKSQKS